MHAEQKWARTLAVAFTLMISMAALGSATSTSYPAAGLWLSQGQTVTVGSQLLAMQGDGNLVLYHGSTAVWASNTTGQNCGVNNCFAVFQVDGNLVVYNGSKPLWASETAGDSGAHLVLSDQSPYLEVLGSNGALSWALFSPTTWELTQGSVQYIGSMSLYMQGDGNLVLYQGSTPVWNSGTLGQNCGTNQCFAVFQVDGNLVVYNGSKPLWNSQTGGNYAATLQISERPPYLTVNGNHLNSLWASSAPTLQLANSTHPSLAPDFQVGDTFQVSIRGASPSEPVYLSQNSGTTRQVGTTDVGGNFTYSMVEQTSNLGDYTEVWSVGSMQLSPALSFVIGQLGVSPTIVTTSTGQTSDGSLTGISSISIANGNVTTYSSTNLSYNAQAYYDAYTVATLYDESAAVKAGQTTVTAGSAQGGMTYAGTAWHDYTLQTDHYAVAYLIYGGLYENPFYYSDGTCYDANSDCTVGPLGGAFWIQAAAIYVGSTLANQTSVATDGSTPLADESFLSTLPKNGPQYGDNTIWVKWRNAIQQIIPMLFIQQSVYSNQGNLNTYPLPLLVELVDDVQTGGAAAQRTRTYVVKDTTGRHWVKANPLKVYENLTYVAGAASSMPPANNPTSGGGGWTTSNGELDSNGALDDLYSQQAPKSEVDYWQQYWATGFNAPGLLLPSIPGLPSATIPLMIKDMKSECKTGFFGTQGIELRSDYVGVNGDRGPGTSCVN